MSDEIKEILEELEDCKATKYLNYNLDNKDARIILDYITNLQQENDRLNNITNELEKTIENRLMAVPDDVLDDAIEEIKRTTKIAVYQVILGDLYKLKELKENK